jgi:hypothetical protein
MSLAREAGEGGTIGTADGGVREVMSELTFFM